MVFFVLIVGVALLTYSCIVLYRRAQAGMVKTSFVPDNENESSIHSSFQSAFPPLNEQATLDAGMLYELKEKVEMKLVEMEKQKEMVTLWLTRVEKKMATYEEQVAKLSAQRIMPEKKDVDASPPGQSKLHQDIYLLHNQGVPLAEIARHVGRGKGEVQLILDLRT